MAGGGNTKKKKNMNSYATMGREKFSALLAEIEEKKRKVLSEFDPREVKLLRFVSSSNDDGGKLKPLVVTGSNNNNNGDNKRSRNITSKQIKAEEKRESSSSLVAERSKAATFSGSKETEGEQKVVERKLPVPDADLPTGLSKEVRLTKGPRIQTIHVCVGVIVVMVLLFLGLFERYWRVYYQLEFQNQVCRWNVRHD